VVARQRKTGHHHRFVGKEPEVLLADEHRRRDVDIDNPLCRPELEVHTDRPVCSGQGHGSLDRAGNDPFRNAVVRRR
jgi:hypothetical protein